VIIAQLMQAMACSVRHQVQQRCAHYLLTSAMPAFALISTDCDTKRRPVRLAADCQVSNRAPVSAPADSLHAHADPQ
jgi:hypothetical protein